MLLGAPPPWVDGERAEGRRTPPPKTASLLREATTSRRGAWWSSRCHGALFIRLCSGSRVERGRERRRCERGGETHTDKRAHQHTHTHIRRQIRSTPEEQRSVETLHQRARTSTRGGRITRQSKTARGGQWWRSHPPPTAQRGKRRLYSQPSSAHAPRLLRFSLPSHHRAHSVRTRADVSAGSALQPLGVVLDHWTRFFRKRVLRL